MKRILIVSVVLLMLAACTPSPTAAPLPTATSQVTTSPITVQNTIVPTMVPTIVQSTPTVVPTSTNTLVPTATRTTVPTATPGVIFNLNLKSRKLLDLTGLSSNGFIEPSDPDFLNDNVNFKFTLSPSKTLVNNSGNPRQVFYSFISGPGPVNEKMARNGNLLRANANYIDPNVSGPRAIEFTKYLQLDGKGNLNDQDPWFSGFSTGSTTPQNKYDYQTGFHVWRQGETVYLKPYTVGMGQTRSEDRSFTLIPLPRDNNGGYKFRTRVELFESHGGPIAKYYLNTAFANNSDVDPGMWKVFGQVPIRSLDGLIFRVGCYGTPSISENGLKFLSEDADIIVFTQ